MKPIAKGVVAAFATIALAIGLCAAPALVEEAHAATNAAATAKINSIKTSAGFKPGACGWTNWNSPYPSGWTDCKSGCWYFVANVAQRMYGCYPSGPSKYTLINPGNFNMVGQVLDTPSANPSYSGIQTLIKKAHPGDIIQFTGGPSGWGSFQHTALIEAVDANGVRIYEHGDNPHVNSTYYNWSSFYNTYLDFDVFTDKTKGITLYHFKNYDSKFPSHTHNYSKVISTSYAYGQGSGNRHGVTKTYQCSSCNSKTTKTTWENCSYSNGKCTKCGITKTVAYTFKPITIEEGVYSIRSAKNTGYTIDITGGSTNDGANAQLYKYDGAGAQLFSFVHNADDNTYSIINVKSGKALETQGWNKNSGGNIDQSGWIVGHANKRWYIGQLNDGTYILKNKHSGLFVECKGGTIANGTNIQQYTGNFENNNFKNAQKWVLTKSNVMDTSIVQLGANDRIISTFWTRQDKYNDGFQIRYATKKDMSNAKVVTDPYTSSLGKSVSGFKPSTTYYVQVRTYKHPTGSDGWFHSAWSPIQTVKTTKAKDTSNQVIVPSAQPGQSNTSNNTAKPVKVTTKSTSITKLTKGKKSFTVKWKAQKKYATGYQAQWSTDKKFKKGVKSKFVKGAKKTSLKVAKLKGGKKYYVKVRAYKQMGKTKYYSSWSKVKTVKTKK